LDLTASRAYSDAGGSVLGFAIESTTNQIGLQFQMPLYQGGGISSKVRESVAKLEVVSQTAWISTRRQVAQQVRESYLDVSTAWRASGTGTSPDFERARARIKP